MLVGKEKRADLTRLFPGKRWRDEKLIQPEEKRILLLFNNLLSTGPDTALGFRDTDRAGSDAVSAPKEFTVLLRETER